MMHFDDAKTMNSELSSTNASSENVNYNNATFETINDDCLREIFNHLNLLDATNLASTCSRLLDFASCEIFPKTAKEIDITMNHKMLCPSCQMKLVCDLNLQIPFSYFGYFVEHLTLSDWTPVCDKLSETDQDLWLCDFENALNLCPNIKKLTIHRCELQCKEIHLLRNVIRSVKELEISYCDNIDWFNCSDQWEEGLSQLKEVKVTYSDISYDFFKPCINLSYLDMDYDLETDCWTEEYFADIFDRNGHCLKRFKLNNFADYNDIATIIAKKLPNLTSLIMDFLSCTMVNTVCQLRHLKHLELFDCDFEIKSSNILMRRLSDRGIIEELALLCNGFVDNDDIEEPPLVFNQLKRFEWYAGLKAFTKSEMPKITDFALGCRHDYFDINEAFDENKVTHELLAFVQSKETLKSINLMMEFENPFAIVRGIIAILKTQSRPYMSLTFDKHKFIGEEEVRKSDTAYRKLLFNNNFGYSNFQKKVLNANQHLIGVNLSEIHKKTSSVVYIRRWTDDNMCDSGSEVDSS